MKELKKMRNPKQLTKQDYWDSGYKRTSKSRVRQKFNISKLTSASFYFYDITRVLEEYMPKEKQGKGKIIEIGCAPGNNIISLAGKFNLEPFGVDYAEAGVKLTRSNFRKNSYNPRNVMCADFFSQSFLHKNKQKYDVVCSFGFVEHFDDYFRVIDLHASLLKKNGVLVIIIPNLVKGNKLFATKENLQKHNLKIMSVNELAKYNNKQIQVKRVCYAGGPFNIGLFVYKGRIANIIRMVLLGLQRIIFEPFIYLGSKLGINLNNRWFSPAIILIAKKTIN